MHLTVCFSLRGLSSSWFGPWLPSWATLKGYSQLWDRAGLDTSFDTLILKSVYLNPKSKLRVVDIYKIRFNRALWFFNFDLWSLIFYSKPDPEYSFSRLLKLFYRIWIKRIELKCPMEHGQKRRETWRRRAEEIACVNENNEGDQSETLESQPLFYIFGKSVFLKLEKD